MPSTVHSVDIRHWSAGTEETVSVTVGIADTSAHLAKNLMFQHCEHGRHFVGVHTRIEGIGNPLGNQSVRIQTVIKSKEIVMLTLILNFNLKKNLTQRKAGW